MSDSTCPICDRRWPMRHCGNCGQVFPSFASHDCPNISIMTSAGTTIPEGTKS